MPDLNPKPKITLEDLIRLKRAERPAAEFWNGFERELRQKQLTALLDKRPWWRDIPQILARRAYLPLGATAVLAFTLVSVRQYSSGSLVNSEIRNPESTSRIAVSENAPMPVSSPALASSQLVNQSDAPSHLELRREAATVAPVESQPATGVVHLTAFVPAEQDVESPSARSIAANLARLEQSEPELVNAVMGSRLSSPARVQPAVVDDMAQIAKNPSRRSRLLAQYHEKTVSPEPAVADTVTERLARRLGDSELTERITRLDLRGPGVSLKF